LTYRWNEERKGQAQERLANRQVSFWYLVPALGETFMGQARLRAPWDYQTGGLWRGSVWGHPVWLQAYRDAPVEVDTIPLHLLDQDTAAPRALGELMVQQRELLERFAAWLFALQPKLWKEMRHMASKAADGPRLDWETIGEMTNLDEVVRVLPPERVIQMLGVDRAIEVIGLERVLESAGPERVLEVLLKRSTPEQLQEILRRRQAGESTTESGDSSS
jgi:hypothetical protein